MIIAGCIKDALELESIAPMGTIQQLIAIAQGRADIPGIVLTPIIKAQAYYQVWVVTKRNNIFTPPELSENIFSLLQGEESADADELQALAIKMAEAETTKDADQPQPATNLPPPPPSPIAQTRNTADITEDIAADLAALQQYFSGSTAPLSEEEVARNFAMIAAAVGPRQERLHHPKPLKVSPAIRAISQSAEYEQRVRFDLFRPARPQPPADTTMQTKSSLNRVQRRGHTWSTNLDEMCNVAMVLAEQVPQAKWEVRSGCITTPLHFGPEYPDIQSTYQSNYDSWFKRRDVLCISALGLELLPALLDVEMSLQALHAKLKQIDPDSDWQLQDEQLFMNLPRSKESLSTFNRLEIDAPAYLSEGCFWTATFDAIEAFRDRELLPACKQKMLSETSDAAAAAPINVQATSLVRFLAVPPQRSDSPKMPSDMNNKFSGMSNS